MSKKILVVEKHIAVRKALTNWLEIEFPKYQTFQVSNCNEACNFLQTNFLDLMIIDLDLSGVSSFDNVRRIRLIDESLKIVVLVAQIDHIFRKYATMAGANECISKHKMLVKLIPAITRLLEK